MSAKTFTPGPWRVNDDKNEGLADDEYHFIAAGDGLCSPPKYKGFEISGCISIEDARLIASAPELLEAVESLYTWLGDYTHEWPGRSNPEGQARLIRMRDVIAKATGRTERDVQDDYGTRAAIAKASGAQS